ncbi:MAG TPA: tetratricopeptide repeat protein, partial [Bauldia sp.]|nr:tetratricopeptide repeat protein [Bauldia sp.]
ILPVIEAELDALPATEIKAESCTDHINAYTLAQFIELSTLRAHGVATGFPDDLPIVKQPDLNQLSLAYAVGWIRYEQGDFDGALAAYGKGLVMFPHSVELQNEYAATLIQLNRPEDVVTFVDKVLGDTYDLDDVARAKMFAARGVALNLEGQTADAIDALTVAQRYNSTDDVQATLDQLQNGGGSQ